MNVAERYVHAELVAQVEKTRAAYLEKMASGLVNSLEEYREMVGYVKALRDFREWIDEIVQELKQEAK